MEMFAVGSIAVVAVMFARTRRQRKNMLKANDWIANRVGQTIQGAGGGGGGPALGMGTASAGGSMQKVMQDVAELGMLNTLAGNPLLSHLAGGTPNWLQPQSRKSRDLTNFGYATNIDGRFRGLRGTAAQGLMSRVAYRDAAIRGANAYGGLGTVLGTSSALSSIIDYGGDLGEAYGAMAAAGVRDGGMIQRATRSWGQAEAAAKAYPMSDNNLAFLLAATQRADSSARRFVKGDPHQSIDEVAADFGTLEAAVHRYRRAHRGGVTLSAPHEALARAYFNNPSEDGMKALQKLANLGLGDTWADVDTAFKNSLSATVQHDMATLNMSSQDASRVGNWIRNEGAKSMVENVQSLMSNPSDYEALRDFRSSAVRAQRLEGYRTDTHIDIVNSPRGTGIGGQPANWDTALSPLDRIVRSPAGYKETDLS